jgi:hypothetical protein
MFRANALKSLGIRTQETKLNIFTAFRTSNLVYVFFPKLFLQDGTPETGVTKKSIWMVSKMSA